MGILSSVVEQRIVGLVLCAHGSWLNWKEYWATNREIKSSSLFVRTTCNSYESYTNLLVVRGSTLIKPHSYAAVIQLDRISDF